MILGEKLSLLRKQNGYSQEELADKLHIARQTVSKWENGLAVPELDGLIALSNLYHIPIDRIVKNDDDCNIPLTETEDRTDRTELINFLIKAKQKTYAGHGAEVAPSRPASHDLKYEEKTPAGELLYIDTYLGGKDFAGEEALWRNSTPLWSMNYYGRVTGEPFSGDFLKAALLKFRLISHTVVRTFSGKATTPTTARPTEISNGSRATKISSIWIPRFTNYISMAELLFNYKSLIK